ncbi:MAG: hypothetical protein LBJ35_02470 [Spirochaetaceae bacterium]|jgi:hypothetical protein|nr:hypothetical protein [Spirochaetaceae bacterium]
MDKVNKVFGLRLGAAVLLLCVNAAFCFADVPFIGTWKLDEGVFYRFNTDGTGGTAAMAEGPFSNDFSFLVWNGTGDTPGYPRQNTLALVRGEAVSPQIDLYSYSVSGDTIRASKSGGETFVFTRVSGAPAPLRLDNPLIGQWEAKWNGQNHSGALGTWSFWYRGDGSVKTYHHRLHQFENAYLTRGNLLVIIGEWRFHPALPVNTAVFTLKDRNRVSANEASGAVWEYARKEKARWKS